MRRLQVGLSLCLLVFASTCCPTIWLQVSKDNPAPWPVVQVRGMVQPPRMSPPTMPNRFDVLEQGRPTVAASGFTDFTDPEDDPHNTFARAVDALSWIERTYQPGKAPETSNIVHATLICTHSNRSGLDANCHGLHFEKPINVQILWVKGNDQLIAVNNEECFKDKCTDADLSSIVPGRQGEQVEVYIDRRTDRRTGKLDREDFPKLSDTVLSFVHMTDIHLRDPSIALTNRDLSHKLDRFDALASFEYDEDLESYNQYLLEAVFATINSMHDSLPKVPADQPKFVIHTGDSIDTGAVSELDHFDGLIDRLNIPFFELFGNHDVLFFGNLTPTNTHDNDSNCTPVLGLLDNPGWFVRWLAPDKLCVDQRIVCPKCIGQEGEFVPSLTQELSRQNFMKHLAHVRVDGLAQWDSTAKWDARALEIAKEAGSGAYCPDTKPKVWATPYTRDHGFDLGTEDDNTDHRKLGYYAFAASLEASKRNVVIIALNTEELEDGHGGTRGRIGHQQLAWLKRVLDCVGEEKHKQDLVLVFAHHPLSRIDVEQQDPNEPKRSVSKILDASPNVVGYFYGHSHEHSICGDNREDKCSRYWEVETASLIEFPQEGRLVRIKKINEGLAFLEVTALRERLTSEDNDLARYVRLARRGAERDFCYTRRGSVRCSGDKRPYRTDGRDANARLFFALPKTD